MVILYIYAIKPYKSTFSVYHVSWIIAGKLPPTGGKIINWLSKLCGSGRIIPPCSWYIFYQIKKPMPKIGVD